LKRTTFRECRLSALRTLTQRRVIGTMFGFLSNDFEAVHAERVSSTAHRHPVEPSKKPTTSPWHDVRVFIQGLDQASQDQSRRGSRITSGFADKPEVKHEKGRSSLPIWGNSPKSTYRASRRRDWRQSTWFGTKGSEVQILSPRPILSITYNPPAFLKVLNRAELGSIRSYRIIYSVSHDSRSDRFNALILSE
jgi:hypothetical protein